MKTWKKRLPALLLALVMCLTLLPGVALADGVTAGPYDTGYGYTISETEFVLEGVEYDGTEKIIKNAFSYTVSNIGTRSIT